MQGTRKLFNGIDHAGRGTVDCIADDDDVSQAERVELPPAGARPKRFDVVLRITGMRACKYQILGLQFNDLLQIDPRPFLYSVHDRLRSRIR